MWSCGIVAHRVLVYIPAVRSFHCYRYILSHLARTVMTKTMCQLLQCLNPKERPSKTLMGTINMKWNGGGGTSRPRTRASTARRPGRYLPALEMSMPISFHSLAVAVFMQLPCRTTWAAFATWSSLTSTLNGLPLIFWPSHVTSIEYLPFFFGANDAKPASQRRVDGCYIAVAMISSRSLFRSNGNRSVNLLLLFYNTTKAETSIHWTRSIVVGTASGTR